MNSKAKPSYLVALAFLAMPVVLIYAAVDGTAVDRTELRAVPQPTSNRCGQESEGSRRKSTGSRFFDNPYFRAKLIHSLFRSW